MPLIETIRATRSRAPGRVSVGLERDGDRAVVPVPALVGVALLLVEVGRHLVVELAAEVDEQRDPGGREYREVPDRAVRDAFADLRPTRVDLAPPLAPVDVAALVGERAEVELDVAAADGEVVARVARSRVARRAGPSRVTARRRRRGSCRSRARRPSRRPRRARSGSGSCPRAALQLEQLLDRVVAARTFASITRW